MGSVFSGQGLTQPGTALTDPTTGQTTQVGRPQQILSVWQHSPSVEPQFSNPMDPSGSMEKPQGPQLGKATFQQAQDYGATPGGVNAASPLLNKAGKLATLLTSGLQGALAGRAANEEATVQSGGRRSGGAGMAFTAGYELPWQRQQALNQLQQQQAQIGLLRAQSEMVPTPYGYMPAALARYILPAQIRGQATVGAAEAGAQGRIAAEQIGQRFKPVQGVGLYDTQAGHVIPGTASTVMVTPDIAADYGLPQEFIGKPMNLSNLSSLENAQNRAITTVSGAAGPALVNKRTQQTTPLGLGNPAMGRPIEVADVNNPGQVVPMVAGQAINAAKQGQVQGPSSATTEAARGTLKSATSGAIANQSTAFQTALAHAQLLEQALTALQNGQTRLPNAIKNAWQKQMGSAAPTNFQAIAHAYANEVQRMLSTGHITEGEQEQVEGDLPASASPQQILGAINSYKQLAQSKMNILQQQVNRGMQGKANFPTQGPAVGDIRMINGQRAKWDGKGWLPAQ